MDYFEPSSVYTYQLALYPPYTTRRGILLQWPDDSWTEASPLEGWSTESFQDVLQAIEQRNWNAPFPSLQFGLQKLQVTPQPIPYCGLLAGTPKMILEKSIGLKHAKLKLGGIAFDEAISITKKLSKTMKLRIDFNRSLTLEKALFFAKECACDAIEFYEEPLQNQRELRSFIFPTALDESLREKGFEELAALSHVVALVIKPTMIGNLSSCKVYEKFNKPIVLSSSFESGVGIMQILQLASCLKSPLPLGIDTYRYLKQDILKIPIRLEEGFVYPPGQVLINKTEVPCFLARTNPI